MIFSVDKMLPGWKLSTYVSKALYLGSSVLWNSEKGVNVCLQSIFLRYNGNILKGNITNPPYIITEALSNGTFRWVNK